MMEADEVGQDATQFTFSIIRFQSNTVRIIITTACLCRNITGKSLAAIVTNLGKIL